MFFFFLESWLERHSGRLSKSWHLLVYVCACLQCTDVFYCFVCLFCRHYPKTNFTSVADTPENLRLQQQTKMQSNVYYKEDFEKNRGKCFTSLADTPEFQRVKKMQNTISNVKYHEDFEKAKMGGVAPQQPSGPSPAAFQPSAGSQNNYDTASESVGQATGGPTSGSGKRYRAVYDYAAADEDEVSFVDGDVIMDVHQIDEGWMYGRVERTGQQGMLPANYVEAI
ncbi:LIM and SH3 domain protein 1 isoform X2 [Paralichthys olivaceus]|uniref:LIM and SH3 domain protein 1 isoform X2 n=1 Tax=Paralichthys olivaceus TaxID=8255 RepID=UPI0037507F58